MGYETLDKLFGPSVLAEHLDISEETLAKWRYLGKGPRWLKIGKHVRYRREDVDAWLVDQQADPGRPAA